MITRIKAGILSGIGLILVNILNGILLIPDLDLSNQELLIAVNQIGYLWFALSLWISMKYVLVVLNKQTNFAIYFNRIIKYLALMGILKVLVIIFPLSELFIIVFTLNIILLVNYIILFRRIYNLENDQIRNIKYLHNYLTSVLILVFLIIFSSVLNEFVWRYEISYLYFFLDSISIIFLLYYFKREKLTIKSELKLHEGIS